ncbi:MAG: MMPL family transporter, partial [Planctomycetota bacterium]
TAGASAGMSLSLVYWFGGFEKLLVGLAEPRLGKADAILMSMPAVVYVLALSGAIHLVNYYRDERQERGFFGAVERAVRVAWGPCLLAAFTTAVGLGSLGTSDILPIQKFGIFSAIGVLVAVGLLFAMIPVFLYRFPPDGDAIVGRGKSKTPAGRPWYAPLAHFVTHRHGLASALCLIVMATVAIGLTKNRTSVQLLDLLDESCDLIADYTWLEANLGNLVPMEVIVALDDDQLRSPDEAAIALDDDSASPRYRMTMFERSQMVRTLQAEIESLEPISRALSASTFAAEPQDESGSSSFRGGIEYTTSNKLEESRESLREYLLNEQTDGAATGRELWRVSARVTALGDIDYGQFVKALQAKVEPVLDTYRLRDALVAELAADGVALDRSKVCLLTATNDAENPRLPKAGTPEARLAELLKSSAGVGLSVYPVDKHLAADSETRAKRRGQLARYDAVIALDPGVARKFANEPEVETPVDVELIGLKDAPGQRPKATEAMAVYTGVVPLVYKTQRELLTSLRVSIGWATVLIAGVMVLVLRSLSAGIASMIPNVFPIVMVFGGLGWLDIPVDIGIMMTASVAIGVAVDDTLHFVTWFGRGIRAGLDRRSATLQAYERCATAMLQTTMIGGLGLAVFAVSTFTPTQQFGTLMIIMLGMALVGDLILLPALLCGPLGRFFAPGAPATPDDGGGWTLPISESIVEEAPLSPEPAAAPEKPPASDSPVATKTTAEPRAVETPPRRDEPLSPANAALRSKLKSFRRFSSNDRSV